jgi:serine/threonine-protein kinase RsbW
MTDQPSSPEVISLRIPSRLELLSVLDKVAQIVCERVNFDDTACSQVTMSVIEAGTNAIQHGHKRDASKMVDVAFEVFPDRVEIVVKDHGKGFNPSAVNGDVTGPDHLLDSRGRGIFIMRACMDEVDFSFTPDGTVTHLVKRRHPATESG